MRILPALVGAGMVASIATAVFAQTARATTNPNTKVYAYHKSATEKAKAHAEIQQQKAEETPAHGSAKWWAMQNRFNGGDGGGGQ